MLKTKPPKLSWHQYWPGPTGALGTPASGSWGPSRSVGSPRSSIDRWDFRVWKPDVEFSLKSRISRCLYSHHPSFRFGWFCLSQKASISSLGIPIKYGKPRENQPLGASPQWLLTVQLQLGLTTNQGWMDDIALYQVTSRNYGIDCKSAWDIKWIKIIQYIKWGIYPYSCTSGASTTCFDSKAGIHIAGLISHGEQHPNASDSHFT